MDDVVSTAQAARILDCSKQWVVELIKAGKLEARLIGNSYAITRASIEAHKQQKNK